MLELLGDWGIALAFYDRAENHNNEALSIGDGFRTRKKVDWLKELLQQVVVMPTLRSASEQVNHSSTNKLLYRIKENIRMMFLED